jgi:hypothetical protein
MLEQALRELFEQRTAMDQPPVRASIARAARDGRTLRRRRRAGAIVTPIFAAGAVAAVAIAIAMTPAQTGSRPPRPGTTAKPPPPSLVPSRFNPQYAYAAFGWLPAGAAFTSGSTAPGLITLIANNGRYRWLWIGYARDACHIRSHFLMCGRQPVVRITGRATDVDGRPAYWGYGALVPGEPIGPGEPGTHLLAYQFAGGWATLSAPPASLQKVAENARTTVPAKIRYPVQLRGIPVAWRMSGSTYFTGPAGLESYYFSVRVSATFGLDLNVGPGVGTVCAGQSAVVAGQQVLLSSEPGGSAPATYSLCAPHDQGFGVSIDETGSFAPGVVPLFQSYLTLLGLDPASWTTQPLN